MDTEEGGKGDVRGPRVSKVPSVERIQAQLIGVSESKEHDLGMGVHAETGLEATEGMAWVSKPEVSQPRCHFPWRKHPILEAQGGKRAYAFYIRDVFGSLEGSEGSRNKQK